jgi:hypothetical protein
MHFYQINPNSDNFHGERSLSNGMVQHQFGALTPY